MNLEAGARLGPYEIIDALGAGGMGEVYRARDTRLGRTVAIKILAEHLARRPELKERLEREARAISSLNHPHICALYDVGTHDGMDYLVMEYVEGETLADRLARGPLPLDETLRLCMQVAEALGAAHAKGILHRDLKPGNVQITPDDQVKLLDFGLAKPLGAESMEADVTSAPTMPGESTRAGTILGSPSYMSPEQARGQAVDKRTDNWGFGCILFECLTGNRAFGGDTTPDALAAVLGREPDWSALPRSTPPAVRHVLERCLKKDLDHRLRDVGDARLDLEEAQEAGARPARTPRGARVAGTVTVVILLAAILAVVLWRGRDAAPSHTPPTLAQVTFAPGVEQFPAWSSDGNRIAYSAEIGGIRKIFTKDLGSGETAQLTRGDHDEIQPAWGPGDRTVLFVRGREASKRQEPGDVFGSYSDGDVWQLDVGSGRESRLVEDAANPSWSSDGTRIAVDAAWVGARRIWLVDEQGRNPVQLTSEESEGVVHIRPRWSADGRKIVFQHIEGTRFNLRVADVATKALTVITDEAIRDYNPVWAPSGEFIYFSSARSGGMNIWRVPLSADGEPAGQPQQVTTGAGQDAGLAMSPDGRRVAFSILKQNADLWRLPVSPETGRPTGPPEQLVATTRDDSRGAWSPDGGRIAFNSDRDGTMNLWLFDPEDGSTRQITRGPGGDFQPVWSPDGKRLVFFSSRAGNADIWEVEIESGRLTQLTTDPANDINPFYSPDGDWIAFQSDRGGRREAWAMRTDGTGQRRLTDAGVGGHFLRWSTDGEHVIFRCICGGNSQMMKVPLDGGAAQPLPAVRGGAHISLSPNGSRILDVTGHKSLWVSPLDGGAPQIVFEFEDPGVRIDYPVWSPDGQWILFDRFRPEGGDIWVMEGF